MTDINSLTRTMHLTQPPSLTGIVYTRPKQPAYWLHQAWSVGANIHTASPMGVSFAKAAVSWMWCTDVHMAARHSRAAPAGVMSWFQQPAMRSPRINRHLLPSHTGSIATGVAAGSGHSLVATESAGMFGLGSNKWWQLGVERSDNFTLPQPVRCADPPLHASSYSTSAVLHTTRVPESFAAFTSPPYRHRHCNLLFLCLYVLLVTTVVLSVIATPAPCPAAPVAATGAGVVDVWRTGVRGDRVGRPRRHRRDAPLGHRHRLPRRAAGGPRAAAAGAGGRAGGRLPRSRARLCGRGCGHAPRPPCDVGLVRLPTGGVLAASSLPVRQAPGEQQLTCVDTLQM